ncbi:MAG: hypothetical protein ACYTG7_08195 [Planctomycetota bacterium]|jgi:hypothetical protein
MRVIHVALGGALLFLLAGMLQADEPEVLDSVLIYDGMVPLDLGQYSAPDVVDWNNDGRKDLVVGTFEEGYIYLLLNEGTDLNPLFNGSSKILSGGVPITTTFG